MKRGFWLWFSGERVVQVKRNRYGLLEVCERDRVLVMGRIGTGFVAKRKRKRGFWVVDSRGTLMNFKI